MYLSIVSLLHILFKTCIVQNVYTHFKYYMKLRTLTYSNQEHNIIHVKNVLYNNYVAECVLHSI